MIRAGRLKKTVIPVWIDVFPLDGVPNDESVKDRWLRKCTFYDNIFKRSQYSYYAVSSDIIKKRSIIKKLGRKLFIILKLEYLIDTNWAWNRLDTALKEYDYEACDRLINFCGRWGVKELFPKSVYGEGNQYKFEDLMLNGPEDYNTVLTQMYGDYMTPPPRDQRNQHHIEFV